jgi:FMN phosphatase YigB (HAD superfamily)
MKQLSDPCREDLLFAADVAGVTAVTFDTRGTLFRPDCARIASIANANGITIDALDVENALSAADLAAERQAQDQSGDAPHPVIGCPVRWATNMEELLREALRAHGVEYVCGPDPETIQALWRSHKQRSLWSREDPELRDALEFLHERQIGLAIISDDEPGLLDILSETKLTDFFPKGRVLIPERTLGVKKPNPTIFRIVTRALDVHASQVLHVGNQLTVDVRCALEANAHAALFDPLHIWDHESIPSGARRLRSFTALADAFAGRSQRPARPSSNPPSSRPSSPSPV